MSKEEKKAIEYFSTQRRINMEKLSSKIEFANSVCANDKGLSYANMTECERYGITWGCDRDCPVFQRGECEIQEENENIFNKEVE